MAVPIDFLLCPGYFDNTAYSDRPHKPDYFVVRVNNEVQSPPICDPGVAALKEQLDDYCSTVSIDPENQAEISADSTAARLYTMYAVELGNLLDEQLKRQDVQAALKIYIASKKRSKSSKTQDYFTPIDPAGGEMDVPPLAIPVSTTITSSTSYSVTSAANTSSSTSFSTIGTSYSTLGAPYTGISAPYTNNGAANTNNTNIGASYSTLGSPYTGISAPYTNIGITSPNIGTSYGAFGAPYGGISAPYASIDTANSSIGTSYSTNGSPNTTSSDPYTSIGTANTDTANPSPKKKKKYRLSRLFRSNRT
ncbi:hypothetical protein TRVA0_055S00496 [Trichomonascus vanleenenianus]|uniref:uncharacterized protein n=1 Tax=Trichomonascus vanleenenianus TaxID=2268995 RepID=UPI003ECB81CB